MRAAPTRGVLLDWGVSAGVSRRTAPPATPRQSASRTPPTQARPPRRAPPSTTTRITAIAMSDKPLTDISFSEFDLHPALLAGLEAAGFSRCTPIQALTLPVALP